MYGCKSWTIKKTKRWKIDAFKLWFWRRLLRVPWTARRSNQSIQKEINPEYSLEGLMLKLKLQTFVSHEYMFPDSLSRHNKDLEWRTVKPPRRVTALGSQMDRVIALRQISVTAHVTALFYLEDSRKIHLWGVRARRSKDTRRRAPQRTVGGWGAVRKRASSSVYMFLSPWACPRETGPARSVVCFTQGPHSGPRTFFCSIFPALSLSHRHFGLLFLILPT